MTMIMHGIILPTLATSDLQGCLEDSVQVGRQTQGSNGHAQDGFLLDTLWRHGFHQDSVSSFDTDKLHHLSKCYLWWATSCPTKSMWLLLCCNTVGEWFSKGGPHTSSLTWEFDKNAILQSYIKFLDVKLSNNLFQEGLWMIQMHGKVWEPLQLSSIT